MLMEGLVGITALIAASCAAARATTSRSTPNPQVAIVAAAHARRRARAHARTSSASSTPVLDAARSQAPRPRRRRSRRRRWPTRRSSLANALRALEPRARGARLPRRSRRRRARPMLEDADFARLGVRGEGAARALARAPTRSSRRARAAACRSRSAWRASSSGLPGMRTLLAYWYHFAIMFEALFILTTIDTGTRIGRFLMQEFVGRASAPLGEPDVAARRLHRDGVIVAGWSYFILTGLDLDDLADVRDREPAARRTALASGPRSSCARRRRRSTRWSRWRRCSSSAPPRSLRACRPFSKMYLPLLKSPRPIRSGWSTRCSRRSSWPG